MRDGGAKRAGCGALRVSMDPLMVLGCIRKGIHALLVNGHPITCAQLLTGRGAQLVSSGEFLQRRSLSYRWPFGSVSVIWDTGSSWPPVPLFSMTSSAFRSENTRVATALPKMGPLSKRQ